MLCVMTNPDARMEVYSRLISLMLWTFVALDDREPEDNLVPEARWMVFAPFEQVRSPRNLGTLSHSLQPPFLEVIAARRLHKCGSTHRVEAALPASPRGSRRMRATGRRRPPRRATPVRVSFCFGFRCRGSGPAPCLFTRST